MIGVGQCGRRHGGRSSAARSTFTPDADFNGADSFTYTVQDNGTTNGAPIRKTATATVNVTVTEVNDAPTAVNDTTTVAEDSARLHDRDADRQRQQGPGQRERPDADGHGGRQRGGRHGVDRRRGTITLHAGRRLQRRRQLHLHDPATTARPTAPPIRKSDTAPSRHRHRSQRCADGGRPTRRRWPRTARSDAVDVRGQRLRGSGQRDRPDADGHRVVSRRTARRSTDRGSARHDPVHARDADYNGPDSFTLHDRDNGTTNGAADPQQSDAATVSVTVTEVNDAPDGERDTATVPRTAHRRASSTCWPTTARGRPTSPGQTLTITASTQRADGTVAIVSRADPFTPTTPTTTAPTASPTRSRTTARQRLVDRLQERHRHGHVTVTEVNDAPMANSDTATVAEDRRRSS